MTNLRTSRWAAVLLAATIVACATPTTDSTLPEQTTSLPPTSQPETTTSTAAPTTDTTAPTTTTTSDSLLDEAEGSGCTPGEGDLPDGEWYGLVEAAGGSSLEFDLACWFTGDAAARAASEDGEESPPPNDYYVRNANPTMRTLTIDDDVEVTWYPEFGDPNSEAQISFANWAEAIGDRGEFIPGVWITIEGGAVTEVREQWVP